MTLGFSPCPNDTFIFDALVNKKINTEHIELEVVLEDVQTLNEWAIAGKLDITKISYGVLPKVLKHYKVMNSGGALGKGVGPLLIGKNELIDNQWEAKKQLVNESVIAIPGENTTANFLFSQAFPQAHKKVFLRFDKIENFVASGKGLGVIIHENRFTYQQKKLYKLIDLGDFWEEKTGNPIPLGGIIIKRTFDETTQVKVDRLIRTSLEFSFTHYPFISDYVKLHSQEMSEQVMRQHIDLYVNEYSLSLGEKGKAAVLSLLHTLGASTASHLPIFL